MFGIFGMLTLSGCGGDPTPDVQRAEDAVQSAIDAGADEVSLGQLNKAKDALEKAKLALSEGKNGDARKFADQAEIAAKKAISDAERMEAARTERDNR